MAYNSTGFGAVLSLGGGGASTIDPLDEKVQMYTEGNEPTPYKVGVIYVNKTTNVSYRYNEEDDTLVPLNEDRNDLFWTATAIVDIDAGTDINLTDETILGSIKGERGELIANNVKQNIEINSISTEYEVVSEDVVKFTIDVLEGDKIEVKER